MSRLLPCLFVVAFAGPALAQGQPEIVLGKVENNQLVLTLIRQVPITKVVTVEVEVDGKKVTEQRQVTAFESVTVKEAAALARVKATDPSGKEIPADKLKVLLMADRLVVVSRGGEIPAAYRRLFKDDVVILQIDTSKK